jgi:hypothetical protein
MIHEEVLARAAYWLYTPVPTALVLKVKGVDTEGSLTWNDIGYYTAMGLWAQKDGRITLSRTKMASRLGIDRKTLYRSLERLYEAGGLRWEETVDRSGTPVRNVVLLNHKEMQNDSSEQQSDSYPDELLAAEANPAEEGVPAAGQGGGAKMPQGRGKIAPGGGAKMPLRNNKKEEQKEDQETATACADAVALAKESSATSKDNEKAKRKKRSRRKKATRSLPDVSRKRTVIEAAVETVEPPGKTSRRGKSGGGNKTHPRNPAIDRLWTVWATEIKARNPMFAVPAPSPKFLGQLRHLFKQFGEETSEKIIQVAIWDWKPIQETIQVWKTKDVPFPEPGDILFIATQLAGSIGKGVYSSTHRVSEYHKRFIAKTDELTAASKVNGKSLAQQMREKYRPRR